jgi:hypothetical protein
MTAPHLKSAHAQKQKDAVSMSAAHLGLPAPVTPDYLPAPGQQAPNVRRSPLAVLAEHLTARDAWIVAMVHEHRVLTSTQIRQLAFAHERIARRRLALLTNQLRLLDRFRPRRQYGSAPEHYVLGPTGAAYLAVEHQLSPKQFGYSRQRAHQIAISTQLEHHVGCNEVFTRLAAAHHRDPAGGRLAAWWSERRCQRLWGDLARPDGYGHYTLAPAGTDASGARNLRFFLEYDTGTETLARVAAKLPGYAKLAAATTPQLVLFYLPGARREENLHRLLAQDALRVPVATTSPDALNEATTGPTGPVWRPVTGTGTARIPGRRAPRLSLIDLDTLTATRQSRQPRQPRQPRPSSVAPSVPTWWTEPPPPLLPPETAPR